MKTESYEELVLRLIEMEKKYDQTIKKLREERKREHNLIVEVRKLLENATVLLPQTKYSTVILDDAGYIKEILDLENIITRLNNAPDVSGGFHKLLNNQIVVDEERKRLIEEMLD